MNLKKREELVKQISDLLSFLTPKEKQEVLDGVIRSERAGMPISVFKANLSGLEIIIRCLRELENKSFKEISKILDRKLSTLYNTYNKSKIKFEDDLDISDSSVMIPFDIFANRRYSILENIVVYLKEKQNLSFNQISLLLNKSHNTVRTVYRRFKIKRKSAPKAQNE